MNSTDRMREEVPDPWLCGLGAVTCEVPSKSLDLDYLYFKPRKSGPAMHEQQPSIEIDGVTYYRWWVHHKGGLRVVIWAPTSISAMRVARRRADDGGYWAVPQRAVPAGRFF